MNETLVKAEDDGIIKYDIDSDEKIQNNKLLFTISKSNVNEKINEKIEVLENEIKDLEQKEKNKSSNIILNKKEENELSLCARCTSPKTGIVMECYTTQPGVQLYTGNWMTGNFVGKNGQRYPARAALCLETQHYPDSPNKSQWPSVILEPGQTYHSQCIFKFGVEK